VLLREQQKIDNQQRLSWRKGWIRISKASQGKEKENSEEWIKIFSQETEGEIAATLKLTGRKEEEHVDKMLTPWEKELEMLENCLNHPELVDDCHE
jgi:hypothetical protein